MMLTAFPPERLADPDVAHAEKIVRTCVHCGFCTAACPTYLLLGDELDSPRGRIYLIKEMLENDRPADARTTMHIDRCLSCLGCMSVCPSGVDYMHLVDHARAHIEQTFKRPLPERALRQFLAWTLPHPRRFRLALAFARTARPFARFLPGRWQSLAAFAPARPVAPAPTDRPQVFPAIGERVARAAILTGCAQSVLAPHINAAAIRFLTRHGVEVVVAEGAECCGALTHHLGKRDAAIASARETVRAWRRAEAAGPLDHIVVTASGCGTMIKDYGHLFREDPELAKDAARVASLARDITEVAETLTLKLVQDRPRLRVAYHAPCSMQHGQKITAGPINLLAAAGFEPVAPADAHICCGSAGTYNLLQPEIARELRDRKVDALRATGCSVVATGNLGCMTQIASAPGAPSPVHTIELLDWATGGPLPSVLTPSCPA